MIMDREIEFGCYRYTLYVYHEEEQDEIRHTLYKFNTETYYYIPCQMIPKHAKSAARHDPNVGVSGR